MRAYGLLFMLAVGLILTSCSRDAHREGSTARQIGEDAHRASEEIKRDAEKARQDLRKAGKEVREGWNEAKRSDDSRTKRKRRPQTHKKNPKNPERSEGGGRLPDQEVAPPPSTTSSTNSAEPVLDSPPDRHGRHACPPALEPGVVVAYLHHHSPGPPQYPICRSRYST